MHYLWWHSFIKHFSFRKNAKIDSTEKMQSDLCWQTKHDLKLCVKSSLHLAARNILWKILQLLFSKTPADIQHMKLWFWESTLLFKVRNVHIIGLNSTSSFTPLLINYKMLWRSTAGLLCNHISLIIPKLCNFPLFRIVISFLKISVTWLSLLG